MADVTLETGLTTDWKNLKSALSLADGTEYLVDLSEARRNAIAHQAETDDANPPSVGIRGHPWRPTAERDGGISRTYTPRPGINLWLKLSFGTGRITVTQTE